MIYRFNNLNNSQIEPIVARHFTQLDSTNAEALRLLRATDNPPASGTFITTDFQTSGRGQAQNGWFASPGQNYLGSLIYYPQQMAVDDLFSLTQAMSLAVVEMITILANEVARLDDGGAGKGAGKGALQCAPTRAPTAPTIKWPNDIYVGDKKIAGLLIQNSLLGNKVQWSVIGLGLNINETDFPAELREKATSLALRNGGRKVDLALARRVILATSLATLKNYLEPLQKTELRSRYHQQLYRLDEPAEYWNVAAQKAFRGKIRGVDNTGRLLIEHQIGRLQTYDLKEIVFL